MRGHELMMEKNPTGIGWDGVCECSNPDWTDDGWEGQVSFYGTKDEVRKDHFYHVLDMVEANL